MRSEIITGLDLGSTAARVVVGQRDPSGAPKILAAIEVPSEGVCRGTVTSVENATSSIAAAFEAAERVTGVPVDRVWVGISGDHIIFQKSKGVVAVAKPNGEIDDGDVERSIEASRAVATPPNFEILHVIPRTFSIDNQVNIRDPLGMSGVRLEVETQIIQGLSSHIKNLTKCIYRTGVDIEDVVFSILAASEAVCSPRQKELGVAVANIGRASTELAVFEGGDVMHTAFLPIGGDYITSDVAIGLRTSLDAAEKIKLEHGTALPKEISKRDEVNLGDYEPGENSLVSKKYIAEIVEARVEEIFEKIDDELKKIGRSGLLPSGVVLVGSTAKLQGILDVAKRKLRLPVSLGYPQNIMSVVDKVNDVSFVPALGLVLWGNAVYDERNGGFTSRFKSIDKVTSQVKKWFKSLMP
ncbi:cell division protein FtsA [Candidatus Falkowbacteria bacterium]|nr:cell division protein FtsA [Candidatus Falkowbacteria bacterium]